MSGPSLSRPRHRLFTATLVCYLLWLLMVGRWDLQEWLLGLPVALLTAWISAPHLHLLDGIRWSPLLPLHLVRFLLLFAGALLRSNLDMARRVVSPSLPIDPQLTQVETRLTSPLGKLLLANCITLTPGTLSVDLEGQLIQVHWIDAAPGGDTLHATRAIAEEFELFLAEFLY